jgi:hypothetical protein
MCGLCGSLGGRDWTDGVASGAPSAVPHDRRRARRARAGAASRVLAPFGLSLTDWQGSAFVLRHRTGASVPVGGLLDLWPTADKLAGRAIDPLDPELIGQLIGRLGR